MNRSSQSPIIGLTCTDMSPDSLGILSSLASPTPASYLSSEYSQVIYSRGGIAVLLPSPVQMKKESLSRLAHSICSRIDGLILTGGADYNPLLFRHEPESSIGRISPERDMWEMELVQAAFSAKLPILAICRGMQILNTVAGGTLWQDISNRSTLCHAQKAPKYQPTHSIRLLPNSWLIKAFGLPSASSNSIIHVNSFHHQAVRYPAPGFIISSVAKDGLVESIEKIDSEVPVVGIQWHPEGMIHNELQARLFDYWMQEVFRCKIN